MGLRLLLSSRLEFFPLTMFCLTRMDFCLDNVIGVTSSAIGKSQGIESQEELTFFLPVAL